MFSRFSITVLGTGHSRSGLYLVSEVTESAQVEAHWSNGWTVSENAYYILGDMQHGILNTERHKSQWGLVITHLTGILISRAVLLGSKGVPLFLTHY